MKTRRYAEGKNVVLGQRWFSASYAVPIFFGNAAIARWLKSGVSVNNVSMEQPYRILKVFTICQMEFGKLETKNT